MLGIASARSVIIDIIQIHPYMWQINVDQFTSLGWCSGHQNRESQEMCREENTKMRVKNTHRMAKLFHPHLPTPNSCSTFWNRFETCVSSFLFVAAVILLYSGNTERQCGAGATVFWLLCLPCICHTRTFKEVVAWMCAYAGRIEMRFFSIFVFFWSLVSENIFAWPSQHNAPVPVSRPDTSQKQFTVVVLWEYTRQAHAICSSNAVRVIHLELGG